MQDFAYSARMADTIAASDLDLSQAGRYLDQAVTANPQDLKAHLQRIHFHWQKRKRDAVFTALVDLFLILGTAGTAIRNRLVRNCEALLTSEQRVFLLEHLNNGLVDGTLPPAGARAIANNTDGKSAVGDVDLANAILDGGPRYESEPVALLLAQEYQRHGWDDLAKGLLQELVATDPKNAVARRTLLQLP
jgi:hypothetical protein